MSKANTNSGIGAVLEHGSIEELEKLGRGPWVHGPYSRFAAVAALEQHFGGTDFRRVFEHLETSPAEQVTIITDGFGPDLEKAPAHVKVVEIFSRIWARSQ